MLLVGDRKLPLLWVPYKQDNITKYRKKMVIRGAWDIYTYNPPSYTLFPRSWYIFPNILYSDWKSIYTYSHEGPFGKGVLQFFLDTSFLVLRREKKKCEKKSLSLSSKTLCWKFISVCIPFVLQKGGRYGCCMWTRGGGNLDKKKQNKINSIYLIQFYPIKASGIRTLLEKIKKKSCWCQEFLIKNSTYWYINVIVC